MNKFISKIEIDGFRSLRRVSFEVGNTNIFSGLNDVGKSNILKALNLFFNDQTDFGSDYDFDRDYSKVSLAAAQRSNRKKQQVKIKLHLIPPPSFKSLQNDGDIWIERRFDRFGKMVEDVYTNDAKKRSAVTRLVNTIEYHYIPALKGPDVLRFLLGLVGKRRLINDQDIEKLNITINDNIKDLSEILIGSTITTETKFELPILVEDFWQRLNINTKYDEFSKLDAEINPSKKGTKDALRGEYFQIPLELRGDGIKSKYIPPLLQWIQKREPNKHYVWGIDEPENSLEFKKAQEVADLYFSVYSKNTQLFLTSHSLAFIFPPDGNNINVFRCAKGNLGETEIVSLDEFDLFAQKAKLDFADEIGALEIQKEIYEEWKIKDAQIRELNEKFSVLTKPVIFVEGEIDEQYLRKTLEIFGKTSTYPADIECIGYKDEQGNYLFTGKDNLEKAEKFLLSKSPNKKTILFYDVDCKKTKTSLDNVVVYCPDIIENAKYVSGIEHLLVIPDTFNISDSKYLETQKKGDKTVTFPNKTAILAHVMSLPITEQKQWLAKLDEILGEIKNNL